MPRQKRIHYYGAMHHVMIRGNAKQQIFFDDEDRAQFYKIMAEAVYAFGCKIHLFCLMKNHVHFVIEVAHVPLSKIMQSINARYTRYINRTYDRVGHLFQGRYKAEIIQNEKYFLTLCYYIHQNPVRANLSETMDGYPWSSHLAYAGKQKLHWLTTNFLIQTICHHYEVGESPYLSFISNQSADANKNISIFPKNQETFCATDALSRRTYLGQPKEMPRINFANILKAVCDYFDVQFETVRSSSRSKQITLVRNITATIAHYHADYLLKEIAVYFRQHPDTVSRSLHRFLRNKAPNSELNQLIALLTKEALKKVSR